MPVEKENRMKHPSLSPGHLGTDKKDSMKKRKSKLVDQAYEVLPYSGSLKLSDSYRAEEKSKSDDKLKYKERKNETKTSKKQKFSKKQKYSHENSSPVANRCEGSNSPRNEVQVGGWGDAFRAAASIVDDSIVSSEDEACGDDGVLGISQFVCSRITGNCEL